MKTIQLFILAVGFPLISCSQTLTTDNLPSLVQNGLKTQFPDATNIEWEKKGEHFEAEFDLNQIEYTALLDASGKIMMHKHDVEQTVLPQNVIAALQKDHPGYKLDDVEEMTVNGATVYQVELEKDGWNPFSQDVQKVYTAQGTASNVNYWE